MTSKTLPGMGVCLLAPRVSVQADESNERLAAQATDPTVSLMSFQSNDGNQRDVRGVDGLANKDALGPQAGFVNGTAPGMNRGLFTQTCFSFAGNSAASDVGAINLQPIGSHQLGAGPSISLGKSAFVCDTRKSRWASLGAECRARLRLPRLGRQCHLDLPPRRRAAAAVALAQGGCQETRGHLKGWR